MPSVVLQIHQFGHLIGRVLTPPMAELGLNLIEAHVLLLIASRRGRLTVHDVRIALGLTPQNTSCLLRRLERMGYVRRARADSDRRFVVIELTHPGRWAAAIARDLVHELEEHLFARTDPRDLGGALMLFERLARSAWFSPGQSRLPGLD